MTNRADFRSYEVIENDRAYICDTKMQVKNWAENRTVCWLFDDTTAEGRLRQKVLLVGSGNAKIGQRVKEDLICG